MRADHLAAAAAGAGAVVVAGQRCGLDSMHQRNEPPATKPALGSPVDTIDILGSPVATFGPL
ncbi:MAG: hypothetical protein LBH13_05320 [Cellulomonadaceae bacterium]|jgi:hypothetical protein|nr:hypothetical protein [Cellulomonadaceae bacterium]